MRFIELTGAKLTSLLAADEMDPDELLKAGVNQGSIVRVNQQGDIEVRRPEGWDLVGGLLGDYAERLKRGTGLDWA